ncbi:MAG TPA: bifunctional diaminohydroxyphosphoribosylaminopyrimidine deaminase/5-amino-6-(5-phosphoribosylamino)uracil reductase RibD [Pseudogracilibacillus sp.]|nr:bifunctional diaminohydroxyphosphoribosylaminopyrimidine deaminase/5-amino-6-(5-phosphoribosylamino)uracil reductase RibD [Pseudogracilibacillus sp.]
MQEERYMKLALTLAAATKGQTSPNPQVGAVLVKNGEIIGTGTHLKAGSDHAEVRAIQEAGGKAEGADLYVTLEPCAHTGKTKPCTTAIIAAGIQRVIIAILDPNPKVAGKGRDLLEQAGIKVNVGLMEKQAREINETFVHYIQTKKPYVTLKAATSMDGKTAAKTGDSTWITSPESRQDVHQIRHENDAILVGIQTIIQDNPQLTTRLPRGGIHPIRVILDTHLRIPKDANVITDSTCHTLILTGRDADQDKIRQLNREHVSVVRFDKNYLSITDVLAYLGEREIMSMLVEGGATVHSSFIKEAAFQEILVYMSPKIIGGKDAYPIIGGSGIEKMQAATELVFTNIESFGPDIKITAKPK